MLSREVAIASTSCPMEVLPPASPAIRQAKDTMAIVIHVSPLGIEELDQQRHWVRVAFVGRKLLND